MTKTTTPTAVAVFHVLEFGKPAAFPDGFELVATVEIPAGVCRDEALGRAYQLTNNIDQSWTHNPGLELHGRALARNAARSTSVCDVMQLADGSRFTVSPIGFEPLEGGR